MLRNLYLYTILISSREWPTRDFGTLIDHFGISAYAGMMKSELTVISHVSERTNIFLSDEADGILLENYSYRQLNH